jgi:hypothetical protein
MPADPAKGAESIEFVPVRAVSLRAAKMPVPPIRHTTAAKRGQGKQR